MTKLFHLCVIHFAITLCNSLSLHPKSIPVMKHAKAPISFTTKHTGTSFLFSKKEKLNHPTNSKKWISNEMKAMKSMDVWTPLISFIVAFGKQYSNWIDTFPIITKSITAGVIFGLSDAMAQIIETKSVDTDKKRIIYTILIGLLYFGPAAHAWYEIVFALFPSTTLVSTLIKATLGQLLFSPSFTCLFFATSLLQTNQFSIKNWFDKIKSDLPTAWKAGLGFWPLVDLISYSLIPPQFIPLFINGCSFVWTIYLSLVSNR